MMAAIAIFLKSNTEKCQSRVSYSTRAYSQGIIGRELTRHSTYKKAMAKTDPIVSIEITIGLCCCQQMRPWPGVNSLTFQSK